MSQPVSPMDICMVDFVAHTNAQKEFCAKVEKLVEWYQTKLVGFMTRVEQTVSSVPIRDIETCSCRGFGFLAWRAGVVVAEHENRCLFYCFYASSHLFTILDKCPQPLQSDGHHYHFCYEGDQRDEGASDRWKQFPVGVVLEGLKALLTRLQTDDSAFLSANEGLDKELQDMGESASVPE